MENISFLFLKVLFLILSLLFATLSLILLSRVKKILERLELLELKLLDFQRTDLALLINLAKALKLKNIFLNPKLIFSLSKFLLTKNPRFIKKLALWLK